MALSLKKFAAIVLIAVLVIPTTFFAQPPKQAYAGGGIGGCIGTLLGLMGAGKAIVSMFTSVPVGNMNIETSSGITSGATTGDNLKNCVLDVLVSIMAQALINNLTSSIVTWINSGFEGSPSFVTNPEAFFADVGDQAAGQFISELGDVGKLLCSPFDLQIRISLGLGFNARLKQYTGCRLSDVQKNVYNAFTGGQWGKAGWSNFISVSQPQNNVYGAYLYSSDAMNQLVLKNLNIKQGQLAQGRGFLSKEVCDEYEAKDPANETGSAKCIKSHVVTPGSVIEAQLNNSLFSGVRRIEMADNINAIFEALANQAVTQIFRAGGGLLGLTKSNAKYGGKSYVQNLVSSYQSQTAAATAKPPAGIACTNPATGQPNVFDITESGKVQTVEAGRWDTFDTNDQYVVSGTVTEESPDIPAVKGTISASQSGLAKYFEVGSHGAYLTPAHLDPSAGFKKCVPGLRSWESVVCHVYAYYPPGSTETTAKSVPVPYPPNATYPEGTERSNSIQAYARQIENGCINSPVDTAATAGVSDALANGQITGSGGGDTSTEAQSIRMNVAGNAPTAQTGAMIADVTIAPKAVDGTKNATTIVQNSDEWLKRVATTAGEQCGNEWWKVWFKDSNLDEIRIYPDHNKEHGDVFGAMSKGNFKIDFLKGTQDDFLNNKEQVIKDQSITVTGGFAASGFVNTGNTGGDVSGWKKAIKNVSAANGLKITLTSAEQLYTGKNGTSCSLSLDEVEVWGTTQVGGTSGVPGGGGPKPSSEVKFDTLANQYSPSVTPSDSTINSGSPLTTRLHLTSSQPIPPLFYKVSLVKEIGSETSPVPLSTIFQKMPNDQAPAFMIKRYLSDSSYTRDIIWTTAAQGSVTNASGIGTFYAANYAEPPQNVDGLYEFGHDSTMPKPANSYYLDFIGNIADNQDLADMKFICDRAANRIDVAVRGTLVGSIKDTPCTELLDYSNGFGTYILTVSVVEDAHREKLVGNITHTFTIKPKYDITSDINNPAPSNYTLTVQTSGAGVGQVTGTGIACGTDCIETYRGGTSVNLNAAPSRGSAFGVWNGCDSTNNTQCTVSMNSNRTAVATFNESASRVPLTVTVSGNGSVMVDGWTVAVTSANSPQTGLFQSGNVAKLTPSPMDGSFLGWGGNCRGYGVCDVTIEYAGATVSASFSN